MKVIVLLLLAATTLAAQKPTPIAAMKGTVTDGARPLGQATVEIFGTRLSRIMGDNWAPQFDSLKARTVLDQGPPDRLCAAHLHGDTDSRRHA